MYEFVNLDHFCIMVCICVLEYATSLQSEDWGLNMEICDIICETEDGCVSCQFQILLFVCTGIDHSNFTTLF